MRVLIAEDDPANCRLLEVTISKWGFEVVVTRNGEDAWEILRQPDAPQLAILDWMMPRVDGTEVCRRLRSAESSRLTYAILLTAKGQNQDIITGLEAGADDYVTKPFDRDELHARLQVGVRMVELHQRLLGREKELAIARTLSAERARFEAAVSAMGDGVLTTDSEWRLTSTNRSARLLLNLPETWEGTPLASVLEPFTVSRSLDELKSCAESDTAFEISRPNTKPPLYLDVRLTCVSDTAQQRVHTVLVIRNVTAERHEQHVRANFLNMASHKLRTPVTVLVGYMYLLRHLPADQLEEQSPRIFEMCSSELEELQDIVSTALNLKRLHAGELELLSETTNLLSTLDAATVRVRSRYPDKVIEVTRDVAREAEQVQVGEEHVRFIMELLIENAVKFGHRSPTTVAVNARRTGPEWVQIAVDDNGPGIPHEFHEKVFEGFVQVEDRLTGQIPGLGVGLYLARQVVRAYGGDIQLQSELDSGTSLTFTLPADPT